VIRSATGADVGFENEEIARVIHEAHRAINIALEDPAPAEPWDALDFEHRDLVINLVKMIKGGASPDDVQEEWIERMEGWGWVYGVEKNPTAEPPTHPAMLPWGVLGKWYRAKIALAFSIVSDLA
jgi:hypothetical protein